MARKNAASNFRLLLTAWFPNFPRLCLRRPPEAIAAWTEIAQICLLFAEKVRKGLQLRLEGLLVMVNPRTASTWALHIEMLITIPTPAYLRLYM